MVDRQALLPWRSRRRRISRQIFTQFLGPIFLMRFPIAKHTSKQTAKERQNDEHHEKSREAINGPPIIADLIRQEIDERLQSFLKGVHRLPSRSRPDRMMTMIMILTDSPGWFSNR